MRRVSFLFLFLVLMISASVQPAFCKEDNPGTKLGRGLANIFTGWLEFPAEIGRQIEKRGDIAAAFVGPVLGLGKAIGRTAVGFYEALTFPIPIPPGYRSVLEKEYVLQSENTE